MATKRKQNVIISYKLTFITYVNAPTLNLKFKCIEDISDKVNFIHKNESINHSLISPQNIMIKIINAHQSIHFKKYYNKSF